MPGSIPPDDLPRSPSGRVPAWVVDRANGHLVDPPGWRTSTTSSEPAAPRRRSRLRRLAVGSALGLSRYGPEQLDFLRYRPVLLNAALKETLKASGLKMPQVAIPLRVALLGVTQTPSIDAVLEVLGRERVLTRLDRQL